MGSHEKQVGVGMADGSYWMIDLHPYGLALELRMFPFTFVWACLL